MRYEKSPDLLLMGTLGISADAQTKTNKEQAGLCGAVLAIQTQVEDFTPNGGRGIERGRMPLYEVRFDARGSRVRVWAGAL